MESLTFPFRTLYNYKFSSIGCIKAPCIALNTLGHISGVLDTDIEQNSAESYQFLRTEKRD
jgi:hypothetical protein